MATPYGLVLLGFLVAAPPFVYLILARHAERHQREPMTALLARLVFGGVIAVVVALAINTGAVWLAGGATYLVSIVIAPIAEEACKAAGLRGARRHIDELEDGLIHGAAIGLGFALSENLLYALQVLGEEGLAASTTTTLLRGVSSTLLHATATAIVGHMYARRFLLFQGRAWLGLGYLTAVVMHSGYNALVQLPEAHIWKGFLAATSVCGALAVVLWRHARALDERGLVASRLRLP